ncbi:hypothetical protein COHA_002005 [Chlorella ohadii]|uniref:Uncharacterized protein n=1 Tax=Chlorella ohadii TaxID=2649997 RepID=A0AAD5DY50_9CHLO|nr:hypothetical protein COHA_002005 [Chlorella ohadii]
MSSQAPKDGYNSQGNHWVNLGGGAANGGSYRYDNAGGGYYYQNPNGSTYHKPADGPGKYTAPQDNPRYGR